MKSCRLSQYVRLIGSVVLFSPSLTAQALDVTVADENLRQCIQQTSEKFHWLTIADITSLECHNQNIVNIEGIEALSNLQSLSLYNNQISIINHLALPKLKQFNIAKNKLKTLTLENLPELEALLAFGNQLTQLELSALPKLKLLKANNNAIIDIHYSNLPALEKLYLFDNKMATIDIYHLPMMNYMDVRQNPMPDKLYEDMDKLKGVTFLHNGNSRDWQ